MLSQWWQCNGKGPQAEKKIFPEAAFPGHFVKVTVGCGNHPEFTFGFTFGPYGAETASLKHPQECFLGGKWKITHFVQKEGAAVGLLDEAVLFSVGSGECALSCPKRMLSIRFGGRDAQSTIIKGMSPFELLSWIACAKSSFPVPDSPVMRTLAPLAAA